VDTWRWQNCIANTRQGSYGPNTEEKPYYEKKCTYKSDLA
jgi:hypothetical protein